MNYKNIIQCNSDICIYLQIISNLNKVEAQGKHVEPTRWLTSEASYTKQKKIYAVSSRTFVTCYLKIDRSTGKLHIRESSNITLLIMDS